jgi:hypothetical protein
VAQDTFEKVQNESFYASPPYAYRPSIVEYLTTMHISRRGIIADFMHLDKKGKINIESYDADGLVITPKDDSDLNDSELFLWNILMRRIRADENAYSNAYPVEEMIHESLHELNKKDKKKVCKITFTEMDHFLPTYETLVLDKIAYKFGSNYPFKQMKGKVWYIGLGFFMHMLFSFVAGFFSIFLSFFVMYFTLVLFPNNFMVSLLSNVFLYGLSMFVIPLIIFLYSRRKLSQSPLEAKFLGKEILLAFLKLEGFIILLTMVGPGIIAVLLWAMNGLSYQAFATSFASGVILYVLFYLVSVPIYFYYFGKIMHKWLYWLLETNDTSENRRSWLEFKDFIYQNSALAEKPLKYYELWGEFYYYALSVGAIKKFD